LKIDFSGEVLWVKKYGTPGDDIGRCLTVTDEGSILLVSRVENAGSERLMATLVEKDGIKFDRNSMVRTETICQGRHVPREMTS